MKKWKKSSFNTVVNLGSRYAWFNQITNGIALLEAKEHALLQESPVEGIPDEAFAQTMADLGVLVPAERNEVRLLRHYAERFIRPFEFTVELSRQCNFQCAYCYQNGTHDPGKVVSYEVLDACCSYVCGVLGSGQVDDFELNFIGGEPLLNHDRLLYLYLQIRQKLATLPISWRMVIDTNGSIFPTSFLEFCENTTFTVCLSPQQDHDRNRRTLGNQPTFNKIVANLVANRRHFSARGNRLIVRFNLDHQNATQLSDFVSFLAGLDIDGLSLIVVNVVNYDCNPAYHNRLSHTDFVEHCGIALAEMVRQNLLITTLPYGTITPCHVFEPYSCKVFLDGRLSGCDISDQAGQTTIFDLIDGKPLRGRQSLNPLTHKMCMGEYKICNLQVFPMRPYLVSYLYAVEMGRQRLFRTFEEHGRAMRENWAIVLSEVEAETEPPNESCTSPITRHAVF